jgi:hypothetical protein
MFRFLLGGFAAAFLALVGGSIGAAPVPKGAGKGSATPDLKVFFETVNKAVMHERWPTEDDEKVLRWTAEMVFVRALRAAEQKERELPVDFEKLKKLDVVNKYENDNLESAFVIAGDVRVKGAEHSVIFATGDVEIGEAANCVIVAPNVNCRKFHNCAVVAGECIRVTSARPHQQGESGSVLVAGQWIRTRELDDAICHVLWPGNLPTPDEAMFKPNRPFPAIGTNRAKNVIFLNAEEDTGVVGGRAVVPQNCTYLPQKNPIAK